MAIRRVTSAPAPESALRTILDDVRDTFQISWTPDVFEALGAVPGYVQLAWMQLKPSVETEQFVRLADRLARDTFAVVQSMYVPSYDTGDLQQLGVSLDEQAELRTALSALIFGQAQTALAVKALRLAIENAPAGGRDTISWPRRETTWAMQPIPMVDDETHGEIVRRVLAAVQHAIQSPRPPGAFRVIARWPRYLELAWQDLQGVLRIDEFSASQTDLIEEAVQLCDMFPTKVDTTPACLESNGQSRFEIQRARDILIANDRTLP